MGLGIEGPVLDPKGIALDGEQGVQGAMLDGIARQELLEVDGEAFVRYAHLAEGRMDTPRYQAGMLEVVHEGHELQHWGSLDRRLSECLKVDVADAPKDLGRG